MQPHDLSIDPGTNATGVCDWVNGEPVKVFTIRPTGETEFLGKLASIACQFDSYCDKITANGDEIHRVCIEKFEKHHGRVDREAGIATAKSSMIKCSAIKGAIAGIGFRRGCDVSEASKGKIKKEETAQLAKAYGLTGSKDALDAFQIGICAGFDRKRKS